MKHLTKLTSVFFLLIVGLLAAPVQAKTNESLSEGTVDVQHVVSPGGIEAWLVEEHSIPIISIDFGFKGGAYLEKPGKEGTASFLSGVLDEGAGEYDSEAFRSLLEENSIGLGFSASMDSFTGSVQTLSANKELAFELTKLALTKPRFDKEPVERVRGQILVGLKRSKSNPNSIASEELFAKLYPGNPYGRPTSGTEKSVAALSVQDLKAYRTSALTRDRLMVGVVGDISAEELGAVLDTVFGDLPAEGEPIELTPVEANATGGTFVVDFENPQSTMFFGGPSINRDDPDYIPTYVLNYILGGGGFSSRLMNEVREKRGLTYGIYTYPAPFDRTAVWLGQVASDNAKIAETKKITIDEIEKIRSEGVTAEELEDAKRYLTGAFPLRFTSNASIGGQILGFQLAGYDINYFNQRNGLIEAVTLEDIKQAAQRLPSPDEITFVIVGEPEGIE